MIIHLYSSSNSIQYLSPLNALTSVIILNGVRLSLVSAAASTVLVYQPQMIDDSDCAAIGGMKIGKNLPQRHFVHHKSHMSRPGLEPGRRRGGKPATNRLSYGTASNDLDF
jgi:hypothetical protein